MTDAERIEALLDLVDPDRHGGASHGPALAVLGLAVLKPKARSTWIPTNAGWALLGDRGRPFNP